MLTKEDKILIKNFQITLSKIFIHTSDYLCYLRRKRLLPPYPPHVKSVTTLL